MNKKSLQKIEDFYVNLGFRGEKLRVVLENDRDFQALLKEKKQRLTKKGRVTVAEKKKYVLSTDIDFEILEKCKTLEKKKLNKEDKMLVALIKSQLEDDWRISLVEKLDQLFRKCK